MTMGAAAALGMAGAKLSRSPGFITEPRDRGAIPSEVCFGSFSSLCRASLFSLLHPSLRLFFLMFCSPRFFRVFSTTELFFLCLLPPFCVFLSYLQFQSAYLSAVHMARSSANFASTIDSSRLIANPPSIHLLLSL